MWRRKAFGIRREPEKLGVYIAVCPGHCIHKGVCMCACMYICVHAHARELGEVGEGAGAGWLHFQSIGNGQGIDPRPHS